ncbi:hypothetical protein CLIB1423_08S02212 [[Candida] railenensis]|uniref:Uncharacterized protein n=1 Tax=[Candida] railenensis TaxID=45579 RepID=A0A9P0VYF6_9ASCO|nr:hypothetical protein CLIB1423_08S02212 [[Candida] railenensis]
MKVPKITGIVSVVLISLTFLNFVLKSYTYFVFIIHSPHSVDSQLDLEGESPLADAISNGIAQETGDEHHPQTLFVPLLTFIPTRSPVLTRPWVLLTSGFVHEGLVGFTAALVLVFYLGKYVENLWGSREYLQFVLTNIISSNIVIYIGYSFYVHLWQPELFVPPVIHGSMPMVMGLLIAVKQRISNHYIIFFQGNVRIKVTYLPFFVLVVSYGFSRFNDDIVVTFLHSLITFFVAWSYIRFFKNGSNERQFYLLPFAINKRRSGRRLRSNSSNRTSTTSGSSSVHTSNKADGGNSLNLMNGGNLANTLGDRSVQFSLYTFFPFPISVLVNLLSTAVFKLLVKHNLIDSNAFAEFDNEDDEESAFGVPDASNSFIIDQINDVNSLQSGLFDLSPLKGAHQSVSTLPNTSSKLKSAWNWISSSKSIPGINNNMDKRRKLAMREFE